MAYKIGTTVVIDDSGNVDWTRISNKPTIGDITGVTVSNSAITVGVAAVGVQASPQGDPVTYNCYVESLSGGGTSGTVTITANRRYFNCNCQCRC